MSLRREGQPASDAAMSDLTKRIVSAAVMAPAALAAIWAGEFAFAALCWAGAAVVHAEWARLTRQPDRRWLMAAGAVVLAICGALALNAEAVWAVAALVAGALVLAFAPPRRASLLWRGAGLVYAGAPFLALIFLLLDQAHGAAAILWLMLVVWATDICAYFAGRAIGGPRIWPAVSPRKTWAGLAGGMLGAALVGALAARWLGQPSLLPLALFSALTAIMAQAGDFAESAMKRHFSAKDSGRLIPGHGGLMDRVDGLIAASVFVLLAGIARAGAQAPGQGVLVW